MISPAIMDACMNRAPCCAGVPEYGVARYIFFIITPHPNIDCSVGMLSNAASIFLIDCL